MTCRLQIWHDQNEYVQCFSGDPLLPFSWWTIYYKKQATEINHFVAHPVAPNMRMKSDLGKARSCNYTNAGTWRMPWLQINSFNRSILRDAWLFWSWYSMPMSRVTCWDNRLVLAWECSLVQNVYLVRLWYYWHIEIISYNWMLWLKYQHHNV